MSRKGEGVGIFFCEIDDNWTGYQIICKGRYTTDIKSTHFYSIYCVPTVLSAFVYINSFNPLNNPTRKVLL